MATRVPSVDASTQGELTSDVALAELRYRIRKFLVFSERAAREAGLEPQHHQLLLAIKGLPAGSAPTIGVLAERLQIVHHSCVELAARAEAQGLLDRVQSPDDGRERLLFITRRGERILRTLSAEHIAEITHEAPSLLAALLAITGANPRRVRSATDARETKESSPCSTKSARAPTRRSKKKK